MTRTVTLPPSSPPLADGARLGGWWHVDEQESERIVCDLCPRDCHLRPGDRGFCFVRENRAGQMVLSTYGKSTGFCIDPIEKKPLNQFYPGTSVLSFGTAGCNLGCKFCQNWSISKSREVEQLSENAAPEAIAQAALQLGCRSVAYTYNDPVIWAEYASDTARACRAVGIKSVAVTAGYITPAARPAFFEFMDAANVDLKAFTERFYRHLTLSHLEPVKETLRWLIHESPVWTEITNLIIPQENDSATELKAMCDWILEALGDSIPVHFTAFHPDFRLTGRDRTPPETLLAAYDIARRAGLKYPYIGNIEAPPQQSTYCASCQNVLIERKGYTITRYELHGNQCRYCATPVAGRYDQAPGNWGSRRQPVRISQFATSASPEFAISAGPRVAPSPTASSPPPRSVMSASTTPTPAATASLSAEQERSIVRAAIKVLTAATEGRDASLTHADLGDIAIRPVLGAFVSLKRSGKLRGCCGFLGQTVPLAQALAHAAKRTATDDHRFPPVAPRELAHCDVEVWLLSNQQTVTARGLERIKAVVIGKHGLQIARGNQRGLLLPGVAIDHGMTAEQFLEQVCLKAELPPTAWREDDTTLWTFEGHVIRSAVSQAPSNAAGTALCVSRQDLPALLEYCGGNLRAFMTGAAPSYYTPGVRDGNVHGLALSLLTGDGQEFMQGNRLSFKQSLPLQATLFSMAQGMAEAMQRNSQTIKSLGQVGLGLTIVCEPALHGTVAEPDLRGIDPARHMIVVVEASRTGAVYDPQLTADALVASAAHAAGVRNPAAAQVVVLECLTNMPRAKIVNGPVPATGNDVRQPAVAGRFYPANPQELSALVDQCLPRKAPQCQAWPAVMAPHAGLIYSGAIAGQTLARVKYPSRVIVIGPKHTPLGVEWAVAPHALWSIPGAAVASDQELARRLAQSIPGLQLDATAHSQEHAIEVELPFLARLAPETKVVGITIGGGNLARCQQFAAGLAAVIRSLPEQPLLVISSDMNHYASDAETRRLDELALAAMESLDPAKLYEVCTQRHISMCGMLPAVIVMETLRNLGQLQRVERVAYSTSGDVSSDLTRVVGYAGVLFGNG